VKAEFLDMMGDDLQCRGCGETHPLTNFPLRNDRSFRPRPYCNQCSNDINRVRYEAYRDRDYFKWKCTKTKARAKSLGVPFDLTPESLKEIWTDCCPVSRVKFNLDDRSSDDYPELDRFIPSKGYVNGNVNFLSRRINRIKSDVTWAELYNLLEWLKLKQN
jgi:hypothetical protein